MFNIRENLSGLRWPRSKRPYHFMYVGIAFLLLGLFVKLSWELQEDSRLSSIDDGILLFISRFRKPALSAAAIDITALGSPTLITLFTLMGIVLLWLKEDRRACAYLGIGTMGSAVATFILKHLFTRARPMIIPRLVEMSGFSYPSGHSLSATSFYLLLLFLAWRGYSQRFARIVVTILASGIIGGICFSRIYLGVHYPSDVLSGVLFGAAWVFLLSAVLNISEA